MKKANKKETEKQVYGTCLHLKNITYAGNCKGHCIDDRDTW